MRNSGRIRWSVVAIGAGLCLPGRLLWAQELRNERIDLHAVKDQVGIVTRVEAKTAWVTLPQRIATGQTVTFLFYSDGGDPMAVGKIAWVTPLAPYEAYITDIRAVTTRHVINPYDSIDAFEVPTKRTRAFGPRPQTDGNGVPLAKGMFAHTTIALAASGKQDVEPVRAYITALEALKPANRTALAIATAAKRALTTITPDGTTDEDAVDYIALATNLEKFQKLHLDDPVVSCLLRRLIDVASQNDGLSAALPTGFMRSPSEANGNPGTRRP